MRNISLAIALLLTIHCFIECRAQEALKPDKYTLLTEPFNLRPINVHKGQLQISTAYDMAINTKSYDAEGNTIDLAQEGFASINHSYLINIKYGLLEFLQIGAEMIYRKEGVREATENYFSGNSIVIVNRLNEYIGFEDLYINASLSLPFDIDILDFAINGGITVNTSKHDPDTPEHSFQDTGVGLVLYNYHNIYRNGTGTMSWKGGADFQLSFNKLSLTSSVLFNTPMGEVESYYWTEFFENGTFIYSSHPYLYLPKESLNIYASAHYQAISWLDLSLGYNNFRSTGGWIAENDVKYSVPDLSLDNMELGFEIQVSPLLRLSEFIGFSLGGENANAPFYIITSLSFNMFPF